MNETEIMENSTKNAYMFETFKSPKLLGGWLLWIFKTSQIIFHSSINQHKKFRNVDKKLP